MTPTPDPTGDSAASYELAYRQGHAQAVAEVADWLETCVGRIGLWHRAEIAADLRDGSWRTQSPLKGLRRKDLMVRRAQTLVRRRVPVVEWPEELRVFAESFRVERVDVRASADAKVAAILRDKYGLDAPGG